MKPLIDADILVYEIGSVGQDEDGPKSFDFVQMILDGRIEDICEAAGGSEPPTLYLTGDTNFRDTIAVTKPYKGNRDNVEKPYHTKNIIAYLKNQYDTVVVEGMEADDQMCIDQEEREQQACYLEAHPEVCYGEIPERTIICTRDKDLRMMPGWHYGWECGKQREFGPQHVTPEGELHLDDKGKLKGTGMSFFYSQLITGDSTDNIPGLPRCGDKAAWTTLGGLPTNQMFSAVCELYQKKGKDPDYLLEQGRLLWMVRELDEHGDPVMWEIP